jgi:hypothetical protein
MSLGIRWGIIIVDVAQRLMRAKDTLFAAAWKFDLTSSATGTFSDHTVRSAQRICGRLPEGLRG